MEDVANQVFSTLGDKPGFQLAQIRFVAMREENLSYRNGLPFNCANLRESGTGVRVRVDNSWGFAATDSMERQDVIDTALRAFKVAKASAQVSRKPSVELAPEPIYKDSYSVRIDKDPFDIDIKDKMELLRDANQATRDASEHIRMAISNYRSRDTRVHFFSSEGSVIDQRLMFTGGSMQAVAISGAETQTRNLQNFKSRGWEAWEEFDPIATAATSGEEATILATKAEKCPSGKSTFILEPYQLGLTIHESCGHPSELDRVLGYEADFAGTSWLTPEKLNNLQYGNDKINITQNPAMEDVLGHFKYDDEGVQARSVPIVKNGIFVGYQSDREHAAMLGLDRSSGNSKSDGFDSVPIIRMNNMFLEADTSDEGFADIDALVEDTRDGIYGLQWKSHSIDDKRLNFQFATQIGYKIENGEITTPLKNVTYQAITPEFWGACSGLTRTSKIYGLPYCGKGSPNMQIGYVSHGGPWGRFEDVNVGITG
ncbi:MAG: TldD/PmbA family protein [Candidatus Kariarchaeaceae archaeon]|jgi:TldD protein